MSFTSLNAGFIFWFHYQAQQKTPNTSPKFKSKIQSLKYKDQRGKGLELGLGLTL